MTQSVCARTTLGLWLVITTGCFVGGCQKKEAPEKAMPSQALAPTPTPTRPTFPKVPEPPPSLGKFRVPEGRTVNEETVALGNKLFFDKRLSVDGSVACYSCHQNEDGTGGHDPIAIGAKQQKLTRHAPTMWNVAFLPALYWDGRAPDLEAQMKGAWGGGNMGVGKDNLETKAAELSALPEYTDLFDLAFPGEDITADHIAEAVSAYERTLFCGNTAYDRFVAGDASALSAEQKAGWDLFREKAGCVNCHTPPFFSDAYLTPGGAYHNTGVGLKGKKPEEIDVGRMKVTSEARDYAAFKTPSLRNITKSAPYFQDGSVAELKDAVRFMAGGGFKNKNLDEKLKDQKLKEAQIESIIAFLGALECEGKLEAFSLNK